MTAQSNYEFTEGNISTVARATRAIAAVIMLVYPMFITGSSMDLVALLPLLAIYPMYTAVVGWDPIAFVIVMTRAQGKYSLVQLAARFFLFAAGVMMIMTTLTVAAPGELLGWYGLFALVAIFPIGTAIMAENPLSALRDSITAIRGSRAEIDLTQFLKWESLSLPGLDKRYENIHVQSDEFQAYPAQKKAA